MSVEYTADFSLTPEATAVLIALSAGENSAMKLAPSLVTCYLPRADKDRANKILQGAMSKLRTQAFLEWVRLWAMQHGVPPPLMVWSDRPRRRDIAIAADSGVLIVRMTFASKEDAALFRLAWG